MTDPHLPPPDVRWDPYVSGNRVPTVDASVHYMRLLGEHCPPLAVYGSMHPAVPFAAHLTPSDPSFDSTLWVRSGITDRFRDSKNDHDLHVAVAGPGAEADTPRWTDIVQTTSAAFATAAPMDHHWTAVLGPVPEQGAHARHGGGLLWSDHLSEPAHVGPLELASLNSYVVQTHSHPHDRSVPYPVGFWPLRINGTAVTYTTAGALQAAAIDLDLLCQLLSLATERRWEHWLHPVLGTAEELDQEVARWIEDMARWPQLPGLPEPATTDLQLDSWLTSTWDRLRQDFTTPEAQAEAEALTAFDSALGHRTEGRVSDAGARYMVIIESFRADLPEQNQVPQRSKSGKARKGSSDTKRRTEDGLRYSAVKLFDKPAAELTQAEMTIADEIAMTGRRGGTVHHAMRFGSDQRRNLPGLMASIDNDPATTYEARVHNLHQLCRALLLDRFAGAPVDGRPILELHQHLKEGVLVMLS